MVCPIMLRPSQTQTMWGRCQGWIAHRSHRRESSETLARVVLREWSWYLLIAVLIWLDDVFGTPNYSVGARTDDHAYFILLAAIGGGLGAYVLALSTRIVVDSRRRVASGWKIGALLGTPISLLVLGSTLGRDHAHRLSTLCVCFGAALFVVYTINVAVLKRRAYTPVRTLN